MTKLHVLYDDYGQSPWIDNIRRDWLMDGTLQQLVDNGVRGVTSNPAIFAKALVSTNAYDAAVNSRSTDDAEQLFEELAVADVASACDILLPVHERSLQDFESGEPRFVDGFVSLEVSPRLAHDTLDSLMALCPLRSPLAWLMTPVERLLKPSGSTRQ